MTDLGACTALTAPAASDYDGAMGKQPSHNRSKMALGRGGQWLELSITLPASCAEEVGAVLIDLGSPGVVEESIANRGGLESAQPVATTRLSAAFPLEQVSERLLQEVHACLDRLESAAGVQASVAMQLTRGDAWVEQWKRFYRPFKIGSRLVIRPPWETYAAAPGDIVLTLNPGQAFGTGLHATTQLCLDVLEVHIGAKPVEKVLDVGCGSGILSLAAVLLGSEAAYGVDLDPIAVRMARINARLNHLSKRATFAIGSLEAVEGRFDVVVANILLEPILALLRPMHGVLAAGGTIVLSGVLAAEIPRLQHSLAMQGWHINQQLTRDEWAAIVCTAA